MKLIFKSGVAMLILSVIFQSAVLAEKKKPAEKAYVEFITKNKATTVDGKEIKYYLKGENVKLEVINPDKKAVLQTGDSIKLPENIENTDTYNGKAKKIGVTTVSIKATSDDDIPESNIDASDTAVVPGVEFFVTSRRNWVSAKVAYAAYGEPDDLFKYSWSMGLFFDGGASLDLMERYCYLTVMHPTTSSSPGGAIKVEYGPVSDVFKNIEISTIYYSRVSPNRFPVNYVKYSLKNETNKALFDTILSYVIFDQYRKPMRESYNAGLHIQSKESIGEIRTPFHEIKKAFIDAEMNHEWGDILTGSDTISDHLFISSVGKDVFLNTNDGYFYDVIKDNRIVFKVDNHAWFASIEGKYVKQLTDNTFIGTFVNVERKKVDGESKVVSFLVKVLYKYKLL